MAQYIPPPGNAVTLNMTPSGYSPPSGSAATLDIVSEGQSYILQSFFFFFFG